MYTSNRPVNGNNCLQATNEKRVYTTGSAPWRFAIYIVLQKSDSILNFTGEEYKSVAILFSTSQRLKSLSRLQSVNVAGAVIPLSDKVKILGAILDANLTMAPHIKALSSSCFYHIRSFRQIRSSLDDTMALSVASALISSRVDQLNSILYGTSLKHIARLQRI